MSAILDKLSQIYPPDLARSTDARIRHLLDRYRAASDTDRGTSPQVSEQDVLLITYGDQIQADDAPPLQVLDHTLQELIGGVINGVHILPFFPYTSDDGFSVVDYKAVNPDWGGWEDVRAMSRHFRLMFDAVINHISQSSDWFQAFLRDESPYTGYFIVMEPDVDLAAVVRPRTLPLLTPVETPSGTKHVWTTFSADQVDINYGSPDLLLEILDVLLFYVSQGAGLIRLDAIGFMWKEPGTSCIHLPQAHALIQLMRLVLDQVAPDVLLVTETNVPHAENISYFGDGRNEAQMVYNFTLPPLALHAFMQGDATHLSRWAATLETPSDATTFFNFMASHDGIGLRPLEGILPPAHVSAMAEQVLAHGGLVSYKSNSDGSQSPYELNVVYFDALNDPSGDEPVARQVDRFMASQSLLLALAGVPGIYIHSLFGSRNWREGVALTGQNRTINRRKFARDALLASLADPASIPAQVFARYRALIRIRTGEPAFHPHAPQQVLTLHSSLFALLRTRRDESASVLCLVNVTDRSIPAVLLPSLWSSSPAAMDRDTLVDLVSGQRLYAGATHAFDVPMAPYQVRWLLAGETV